MKEEGVLWCILTILQLVGSFTDPTCPRVCICTYNVTYCQHKELETVPPGLDPNVTSLDLAFNNFSIFPDLSGLQQLVNLNISHNYIALLEASAPLTFMRNLKLLDLTYNNFKDSKDIKFRVFSYLRNLEFLDLSHNAIRSIEPISSNSLLFLKINNCSLRNLNSSVIQKLPNLLELHAASNPITFLDGSMYSNTLKFLDLSFCDLRNIDPAIFIRLTSVETIYLRKNPKLKKFSCSSNSLLYLDLSDCNLESVPSGYLPQVKVANFHGNHFREILKYSFANMTNLETLDLSYNAIESVEPNAFRNLTSVEIIDFSYNTLAVLNEMTFYTNHNLKRLNLSRNYFKNFGGLAVLLLEVLDLSYCEIRNVAKTALIQMPMLSTLNLSKNEISALPDYLEGPDLVSLDLSMCRIKKVNNKTFAAINSLRELNLAGNGLTVVHPDCFSQITYLDISDNSWRCDCDKLKEMYYWMMNTGKSVDKLICSTPEKYEGLSWQSACGNEWKTISQQDTVWWYTTALIIVMIAVLLAVLGMRRLYLRKEKRLRLEEEARRSEEREALRRMRRMQLEAQEEVTRNAPDPRELQSPPSYNDALLLPKLDASHPSLAGSLHSLGSKHSLHGSNPDVTKKGRPRRKRRRRKSDSSEGQRASRAAVVDSDTSEQERPQPRPTLESDI